MLKKAQSVQFCKTLKASVGSGLFFELIIMVMNKILTYNQFNKYHKNEYPSVPHAGQFNRSVPHKGQSSSASKIRHFYMNPPFSHVSSTHIRQFHISFQQKRLTIMYGTDELCEIAQFVWNWRICVESRDLC